MTDRRRNLFILLLVAGLLVASLAMIFTKSTRLGLDLQGGVSLTYQAKATKQAPVVVIGRKQVRRRAGGQVTLRVDRDGLGEHAHAPFERGPDVV